MEEKSLINKVLEDALQKREEEGRSRKLQNIKGLVDFCSNDYLGFARLPKPKESAILLNIEDNTRINGSTGSRLLSGNTQFVEELEHFIATYHYAPSGLIYNSGYDANLGLFSSVPKKGDTIIYDELIHASVRDGVRLSLASSYSFKHNDIERLEAKLKNAKGNKFVAVESVYSMDGDFSPLTEIAALCERYDVNLIVDEAHATGLYGKKGEGRITELNIEDKIFARVHTFGKALGCHGAIILGSNLLKQYLINFSRPFIYTTALPVDSLKAVKNAYDNLSLSNDITLKIKNLITLFKVKVKVLDNVKIIGSESPIQSIIIPGNNAVKTIAEKVQKAGFDVRPILSPTVPKGEERLRICLHSYNSEKEIYGLISVLKENL